MERQIKDLPYTDQPTKHMLQGLIERKREFETYKQKCLVWKIITFVEVIIFIVFIYFNVYQRLETDLLFVLFYFFQSSHLFAVLLIAFSYSTAVYFKKKEEKAEKEYHELRWEIIDKSTDFWKSEEEWMNRDKVFSVMKKEFDINLYYKTK
ncbi:DUF2663 family protein [Aeribacillus composti]|uniref:DUF2663 family protein n=1 Tax=Aeribacillus composti TaxID=1868734 RepID=UPI003D24EFC8